MMLGLLLARAGVDVIVIEKHADFLRDFRGDTVHPSTLRMLRELSLLEAFLARPHVELSKLTGLFGEEEYTLVDFTTLRTTPPFMALMPQWDFLDLLASAGKAYPTFRLLMSTAATGLTEDAGRVTGVHAQGPDGPLTIAADLVVACDGRHSTIREAARLPVEDLGAPIDVLWFRLPKAAGDRSTALGRFNAGRILITLDRGDYYQCAMVIAKGGFEDVRARGITAFAADVGAVAPFLAERARDLLQSFDQVKLLTVTIDRLTTWHRPGLLCIGDAAHAMSPMGGVGINLAVQDAVATANALAEKLRAGTVTEADTAAIQERRMFAVKVVQRAQVFLQERMLKPYMGKAELTRAPWPMRLFRVMPFLAAIPARLVGIGVRPEHIRTPDVYAEKPAATA